MTSYEFKYSEYPLIPIRLCSPARETPMIEALLDSGGDFVVIPKPIADYLELECTDAGCVDTAGGEAQMWSAKVRLVAVDEKQNEFLYDELEIHVSGRDDIPVLLGRCPFFDDHEIVFQKKKNMLILKQLDEIEKEENI